MVNDLKKSKLLAVWVCGMILPEENVLFRESPQIVHFLTLFLSSSVNPN